MTRSYPDPPQPISCDGATSTIATDKLAIEAKGASSVPALTMFNGEVVTGSYGEGALLDIGNLISQIEYIEEEEVFSSTDTENTNRYLLVIGLPLTDVEEFFLEEDNITLSLNQITSAEALAKYPDLIDEEVDYYTEVSFCLSPATE